MKRKIFAIVMAMDDDDGFADKSGAEEITFACLFVSIKLEKNPVPNNDDHDGICFSALLPTN